MRKNSAVFLVASWDYWAMLWHFSCRRNQKKREQKVGFFRAMGISAITTEVFLETSQMILSDKTICHQFDLASTIF